MTGLPGSGKSTLGKELARRLNMLFYDLDVLVEEGDGRTVREIFAESGEAQFRIIEKSCLETFLKIPGNCILATGGGTPCFFDNLALMKAAGPVVFLDVAPEEIAMRLTGEGLSKRPLFRGESSVEKIKLRLSNLLKERIPFYRQADIVFQGNQAQDLEQLIRQLL
jgi:shikimate kinase